MHVYIYIYLFEGVSRLGDMPWQKASPLPQKESAESLRPTRIQPVQ